MHDDGDVVHSVVLSAPGIKPFTLRYTKRMAAELTQSVPQGHTRKQRINHVTSLRTHDTANRTVSKGRVARNRSGTGSIVLERSR